MKRFKDYLNEAIDHLKASQFDIAYEISKKAHATQTDRAGVPYMNHINYVVNKVAHLGDTVKTVAVLHDTVEDTMVTLDDLRKAGIEDHIIDAVDAITKRPNEAPNSYYARIAANKLAKVVKLADISHNFNKERLKKLPPEEQKYLTDKYTKALEILGHHDLTENAILLHDGVILETRRSSMDGQPWREASTQEIYDYRNEKNKEIKPLYFEDLYDEIMVYVKKAIPAFKHILNHCTSKNDTLIFDTEKGSIKKLEAMADKVANRGKPVRQMTDMLRAAILGKTPEDVNRIVNCLKKNAVIYGYEYKEKGGDPVYGYHGSHHFDIEVGGILCEIQVMSKHLWTYKGTAHDIYTKLRSDKSDYSDEEKTKLQKQSRDWFHIGNRPVNYPKKETPPTVDYFS